MREVHRALRHFLRADPTVDSVVGRDDFDTPKVGGTIVIEGTTVPYIAISIPPGGDPGGQYGDLHSMLNIDFMLTHWADNEDLAWALFGATFRCLDTLDPDEWSVELAPWYLMSLTYHGDGRLLPERETGLVQIPATYRLAIGRG